MRHWWIDFKMEWNELRCLPHELRKRVDDRESTNRETWISPEWHLCLCSPVKVNFEEVVRTLINWKKFQLQFMRWFQQFTQLSNSSFPKKNILRGQWLYLSNSNSLLGKAPIHCPSLPGVLSISCAAGKAVFIHTLWFIGRSCFKWSDQCLPGWDRLYVDRDKQRSAEVWRNPV